MTLKPDMMYLNNAYCMMVSHFKKQHLKKIQSWINADFSVFMNSIHILPNNLKMNDDRLTL